jgi:cytochrome P450
MLFIQLLLEASHYWLSILIGSTVLLFASKKYQRGLNRYPGPFWASVSDLWQVFACIRDFRRHPYIQLHQKYGDIVRIAPNKLSFASPAAIKDVLGVGKNFPKSGFYFVAAPTVKGHPTPSLFSTLDKEYHDRIKRAVNSAFSMTSLIHYEPYVDNVITVFLEQISNRFSENSEVLSFDLSRWMHYYSLDVISEVVYGRKYGFLETGRDVDDMIKDTQDSLNYGYWVSLCPIGCHEHSVKH